MNSQSGGKKCQTELLDTNSQLWGKKSKLRDNKLAVTVFILNSVADTNSRITICRAFGEKNKKIVREKQLPFLFLIPWRKQQQQQRITRKTELQDTNSEKTIMRYKLASTRKKWNIYYFFHNWRGGGIVRYKLAINCFISLFIYMK